MMIQLTKDLERFVRDAVSTGRYTSEDEVVHDAIRKLQQTLDEGPESSLQDPGPGQSAKRLTKQGLHRHLVEIGLIDKPLATSAASGESDELIDEEGEIVSEALIRERLIEWLIGFLRD
jgi:putative addiction module CopG family antidote